MAFPISPNIGDQHENNSGLLYEFQAPGVWTNITVSGVQSVTGDGVGGTDQDPVLTFPNTSQVDETTDKNYVTDDEKIVIGNTSGTNTGDQDLSGLSDKNTLVVLTSTGNIPNDIADKTVTLDSAANATLTFTLTSFARVGDICAFAKIGVGFPLLAVATGVVFNDSDSGGVADAEFKNKGAMRMEDVGGNIVIDLV